MAESRLLTGNRHYRNEQLKPIMKKIFVIMRKIVSTFLFLAAVFAVATSCKQTEDDVYVGPVEPGDAYFDGSPIDEGTPLAT